MNNFDISKNKKPFNAANANKAGSYRQLFRIGKPVIDPGETLEIEQYFSGYGIIGNSKVNFYTSDDIYDPKKSTVYHSLGDDNERGLAFGVAKSGFTKLGMSLDLSSGIMQPGWKRKTYFFDIGNTLAPQISTEMQLGDSPPILYKLKTRKNIKPGNYSLEFNFTYFNGERWDCDKKNIEFKVRNFLERRSTLIGVLALIASIAVIISSGLIPILKQLIPLFIELF